MADNQAPGGSGSPRWRESRAGLLHNRGWPVYKVSRLAIRGCCTTVDGQPTKNGPRGKSGTKIIYNHGMPNFHRYYIPNATIFITCVTFQRINYLGSRENLEIFWQTLREVQKIHPFHLLAYVTLPDHFHWIMQIPEEPYNFSTIMQSVKWDFSFNFKKAHHIQGSVHIWQNRFWDHVIRNEVDLERHFDYIHWNPVKHQYVETPEAWAESSLRHWISQGYYPASWGNEVEPEGIKGMQLD